MNEDFLNHADIDDVSISQPIVREGYVSTNNFCFNFFNSQLVGLLSKIEKAIVETAGIGWGHCAPSSCTKADFYNNYKVKIELLNQVELIFMEYL